MKLFEVNAIENKLYPSKQFHSTKVWNHKNGTMEIPKKAYAFAVYKDGSASGYFPASNVKMYNRCKKMFERWESLKNEYLEKGYTLIPSCNNDNSEYLVPTGGELSYGKHPAGTLRISDHWSWYSSLKKCPDENWVQCNLKGIPAFTRRSPGQPTTPKICLTIAKCADDGTYESITEFIS